MADGSYDAPKEDLRKVGEININVKRKVNSKVTIDGKTLVVLYHYTMTPPYRLATLPLQHYITESSTIDLSANSLTSTLHHHYPWYASTPRPSAVKLYCTTHP